MARQTTEEPSGLEVGDCVYCASLRLRSELMPGTIVESTVKAKKGMVLVALLLGEEPVGSSTTDMISAMKMLGWQPINPALRK